MRELTIDARGLGVIINELTHGVIYDSYRCPDRDMLEYIRRKTGIEIREGEYQCGCWGRKHEPKVIDDKTVEIEVGVGYKSRKHFHAQNFAILGFTKKAVLIELRKFGAYCNKSRYLFIIYGHRLHMIRRFPKNVKTAVECEQIAKRRLGVLA
jgi:hypothetical protein